MQEIAKLLGITKASTTSLVSSLINDGLVSKRNNENDKRISIISLTSIGMDLLTETLNEHSVWIEKITNNLSDNDVAIFRKVLRQDLLAQLPPNVLNMLDNLLADMLSEKLDSHALQCGDISPDFC